jgi:RND family efflux transporter MFP subunit
MNKKFWIITTLLAASVIAAVTYKTMQKAAAEKNAAAKATGKSGAVAVEAVRPVHKALRDRRMFSGSLRPWSIYDVAPKVGGRLEMLKANIGDPVKSGEIIARIDSIEYRQQYDQAAADLEVASAQRKEAEAVLQLREQEFERQRLLSENNIGSKAQLETAQSALLSQQATLMMTEAEIKRRTATLENARLRMEYTEVKAEWEEGGAARYVGERYMDEGALLQANQPLVSIAEIDRLRAAIYVIERDYPFLHIGQMAEITTDAYPDQIFYGKIFKISQVLLEKSRQAAVLLEIPNGDLKLKPGMFVRVHLEFAKRENATTVPQSAIIKRDGKSGLFVLSADRTRVHFVEVVTGIVSGDEIEILSPAISRPVITLGNHLLSDGVEVLPVDREHTAAEPNKQDEKR